MMLTAPWTLLFLTPAPDETRCTYKPHGLRCIRAAHPDDPDAHVRDAGNVDDAHVDAEDPE